MVRRSLIAAAALLAVGSPLNAQTPMQDSEEFAWSAARPDAHGLLGVFGDEVLEAGEIRLTYNYHQENYRGVYLGTDSLPTLSLVGTYTGVPLTRSEIIHRVRFGLGISDDLTLIAKAGYAVFERETMMPNNLIRVGIDQFTDVEAGVLFKVYDSGAYRMHVQGGAVIPVMPANTTYGQITPTTSGPLPYDMRTGGGSYAVVGGISGSVQNEVGILGAQFRGQVYVLGNNAGGDGYTPGDRYEANGWAGYNVTDYLAVLAGIRWQTWDHIEGADARLDPGGDPHNQGAMLAGERLILPIGVNLIMPENANIIGGHILSLEAMYPIHHNYDGPQLGLDWGINLGYTITLF
jgi:hypothetical protein